METKAEAMQIAKDYVQVRYSDDFSQYVIKTELQDNIWYVYYCYETENMIGGGGPCVQIEKSTGKVVSCLLQK